jgi:hypothetical protein
MKAWKCLVHKLQFDPPLKVESIKNFNLWWGSFSKVLNLELLFCVCKKFHRERLRCVRNLWNLECSEFHISKETRDRYLIEESEHNIWEQMLDNIQKNWIKELPKPSMMLECRNWFGIFENSMDDPIAVLYTTKDFWLLTSYWWCW